MSKRNSQVYVSRFSRSTTEDDLNDNFKQYGKIREISMKNGYAFIEYDDYRDAEEAVDRMDGKSLDGHKLIVEIAGANKKGGKNNKSSSKGGAKGPQPGDKCFNCGKTGHWANECRESKGRRRRSYSSKSRSDSRSSSSSRDKKRKNKNNKKSKNRSKSRSESKSKSRSKSRSRSRSESKGRKSRSKSSSHHKKKNNGDNNKKNEDEGKLSKDEETTKDKAKVDNE